MSDSIPAANAPTLPRSFGLVARILRRWLGIRDQRADFDALAFTLSVKDITIAGLRTDVDRLRTRVEHLADVLNAANGLARSAADRLVWYETRVPQIAQAKRAYDRVLAQAVKRRKELIAAHPELSESAKAHVWATGKLPDPTAATTPQSPTPDDVPPVVILGDDGS